LSTEGVEVTRTDSEESFDRVHWAMASYVESGALPGLVALVASADKVHVEVIGAKSFGESEPMARDAIFRIASLSKPIGAVAAMLLVEDNVLQLDAPIDDLLPELAHRRVLRSIDAELDDTVAAQRSITLEDLLSFRFGFGSIMAPPGSYPIQRAEVELGLKTLGPPWPPIPLTPDEWMARFGSLPLMYQPGERWMYNSGAQVLGVLIERAAGMALETFLRERLFEPIGMPDTAFSVPPEKLARLTTAYTPDPESGELQVLDGVDGSYWAQPPAFPNMAGWLVSTIDDFWAFVRMLLAGGIVGERRIVSQAAVAQMTADRLTPAQRRENRLFLGPRGGWGLGLLVPAAGPTVRGIPGGYGWDGGTGTTWRSDEEANLTGILFTQRALTSPAPPPVFRDFWRSIYPAS
jgi:CubicO group peptidase (beta-lactamase class C family)